MSGLSKFLGNAAKVVGTDVYTNMVNAGGSLINGFVNEFFTDRARQKNYEMNEKAAKEADKRQRAQYNDLYSPEAMLQQYRAAGLSPSMMMSGGAPVVGGTAAGSQGGTSGGYPSAGKNGSSNPLIALQMEEIKSQIEKNKADANKSNAEADTESGENERGKAEIQKLLTENISLQVANKYTESQTTAQEWQNYITSNTADFSIRQAEYLSYKSAYEMEETYWKAVREKQNYEFDKEVFKTRVESEKQNFINLQLDALVKQAGIELTVQQIGKLGHEISMLYDESMRGWEQLDIQRADQETRAKLINKEVDNFERKLDQIDKDLRIKNRNSWFNNINSTIRTVAYSASCVASFIPGNSGTPIPPVLEPSGVNQYY